MTFSRLPDRAPCHPARRLWRRELRRADREPLHYYSLGRGVQTIAIVNAPGHSLDHWAPLRDELMHRFRVLAWQSRGTTATPDAPDAACPASDHIEDMRAILANEDVAHAHVLTCSTAPRIALAFRAAHPGSVASMAFVGGRFGGAASAAGIDVPTLFVNGDGEPLAQADAAREFAAQVPGAIYAEVTGGRDHPHREFPELVGSLVREFFRRGHEFALESAGVHIRRFRHRTAHAT